MGETGSIIVYSHFEKTQINGLIKIFPEYQIQLQSIIDRLVDLEKIIKNGFYHPDFHGSTSISFESLINESNSPGSVYCLSQDEIYSRIKQLTNQYDNIVLSDDAGIKELQIDKKHFSEYFTVLENYYNGK